MSSIVASTKALRVAKSGWPALFVMPLALLWRHRMLLKQTVKSDLKARYAGSVLGIAWLVLYPLMFLGVYALVYVYIFKVRFAMFGSTEYVALIFCGLIPFLGVSEALSSGIGSVTSNASLLKNTLFPIDLIPVKSVLVSQCTQAVGTGLLLIVLAVLGKMTAWWALLPVIWLAQVMFLVGVVWILSSLNVYLRDLQNMMSVVILLLMMTSPIAYSADMVPAALRPIVQLNPLYYLIVCYQDCLMLGRCPRGASLEAWLFVSLAMFFGGYWFFSRLKSLFIDNV